ncbi:MAG: septum formation family protein [Mycobacteriaceae bacterium]|nr:septum formation family protein [Mycobacteriaceae bacterium]MBV9640163.1 septum formation family protein [Mycobacteriaceae bacterium]
MSMAPEPWWRSLRATPTQRALLLTALGGLLIAGITTALPAGADNTSPLGRLEAKAVPTTGSRTSATFNNAHAGDCLNWPDKSPDQAGIVDCKDDHRFEVAESVDMRTFPGSEYGPGAAPPSPARIQQISQEQCQAAVRRYLGTHYDPDSKFTIGMLWSGDKAWTQSGQRRMLCGLELPGADDQQVAFKGKVADLDQSKVWPAGTCLGIENSTNQPTDIPVACSAPHAMEVTGAVNLAEKFPTALPAEADQDAFIKDNCTKMTDAYLAPVQLRTTTLTLIYNTISLPSWSAGSHQVSCSIGATLGNGGWATLVGSARGLLLINGQTPIPPPDIPQDRLNLPPIPLPTASQSTQGQQSQAGASSTPTGTQHMPGQQNSPGPASASQQPSATQQPGDTAAPGQDTAPAPGQDAGPAPGFPPGPPPAEPAPPPPGP